MRAISGISDFDQHGTLAEQLRNVMDESSIRGAIAVWPPLEATDRHAMIAHRRFHEQMRDEAIISSPLKTTAGEQIGSWVFLGSRATLHSETSLRTIEALAPHIASALYLRREAEPSKLLKAIRLVLGVGETKQRRIARWSIAGVTALTLMMPIPYRVAADCRLEPNERRYAVAPYAGILRESFVEPGEVVKPSQVLARMDDRELGLELASETAKRSRALKERDVAMAGQRIAEGQMAAFEAERLDRRIALLKYRQENLEIRSPIGGVILTNDLEDAAGVPVEVGEVASH